jgi:hypothetical protein
MSDLSAEMDMDSPTHSPRSGMASTVNMQEMDMEQDDEDMNVPLPPQAPQPSLHPRGAPPALMISRIPSNQSPLPPTTALPPATSTYKLPTPLKPQDLIIKSYNPKGKHIAMKYSFISFRFDR